MNYKQFTLKITAVNLFGWLLLELYRHRYVNSPIEIGVIFQIIVNLSGYYFAAISSSVDPYTRIKEPEDGKYYPHNCPGHKWEKSTFQHGGTLRETCIICKAERGV